MGKNLDKAIILAAGTGSRLKNILKGNPKPLLKINNSTLIEILIKKLKKLKINKIIANQIQNQLNHTIPNRHLAN